MWGLKMIFFKSNKNKKHSFFFKKNNQIKYGGQFKLIT